MKKGILLIMMVMISLPLVFAATVSHDASQILAATFPSGNYVFQGTVRIPTLHLNNTLGFGNLSTCASGQIIKMSGTSWICGEDLTGGNGTLGTNVVDDVEMNYTDVTLGDFTNDAGFITIDTNESTRVTEISANIVANQSVWETDLNTQNNTDLWYANTDTQNNTDYYVTAGEVSGTTTKTLEIVIGGGALANLTFAWTDLVNHTDLWYADTDTHISTLECGNITGATSNLCTLVDTNTQNNTDLWYADTNESTSVTQILANIVANQSTWDTDANTQNNTDLFYLDTNESISVTQILANIAANQSTWDTDANTQNNTDYHITNLEVSGTTTKTIEVVIGGEAIANVSTTFTDLVNHTDLWYADTTYSALSEFTNDVGYYYSEGNLTALLDDNYADISVTDTDTHITALPLANITDTGNLDTDSTDDQPLEATLTDIADGTIAENLVNTAHPWANDEVSDTLTCSILTDDNTYALVAGETFTGPIIGTNVTSVIYKLSNTTIDNIYTETWNGTCVVKAFVWGAKDVWCP